jgi:hypothetical protein
MAEEAEGAIPRVWSERIEGRYLILEAPGHRYAFSNPAAWYMPWQRRQVIEKMKQGLDAKIAWREATGIYDEGPPE